MGVSREWWSRLSWKSVAGVIASFLGIVLLIRISQGLTTSRTHAFTQRWGSLASVSSARQTSLDEVMNSTLGFERIVAINLPERTDHRDGLVLSSAVSDIKVDFIPGVVKGSILPKVLPPGHRHDELPIWVGAWRAHLNAISHVVENNFASALIIEDDIDWDIRLKSLLQDFALSADQILQLPGQGQQATINGRHVPKTSPYGDGWDVLWLGHCGMELPNDDSATVIVHYEDISVPQLEFQTSWDVNAEKALRSFPPHSRVAVPGANQGTCSLAYAVSRSGARKLLADLGLKRLNGPFDLSLRDWCEGNDHHEKHMCISVLPQLFDHLRSAGSNIADSEVNPEDNKHRDKSYTPNIRWSVKLNMDHILRGDGEVTDQYPDIT